MLQQQLNNATQQLNQSPEARAQAYSLAQNKPPVIDTTTAGRAGGRKAGTLTTSPYSQWALDLMRNISQQGAQGLPGVAQGLEGLAQNKFNFGPISDWARTNFAQTTVPSIAERFSSLGTGGSQRSSYFPQMLSQAGSNLDQQLAAMKADYDMRGQALNQGLYGQMGNMYLSMLGSGLQPQWQTSYMANQPGWLENFITALGGKAADAGMMAAKGASMAAGVPPIG